MAVSEQDIIPGYDPTAQASVTAAQLYQMVAEAGLNTDKGIIILSNDTPDTATYPKFKKYLWVKPSENGKIIRAWNEGTASWEAQTLGAGAVGTTELADNSVTLAKLYDPGVPHSGKQLTVLPDGTFGLVLYVPPVAAIGLSQIDKGSGNAGRLVRVKEDDSGLEYFELAASDFLEDGTIDLDALNFGAAYDSILYRAKEVDLGGIFPISIHAIPSLWEDDLVPLDKLEFGTNGQIVRMVAGVPTWQANTFTAKYEVTLGAIDTYDDTVLTPTAHSMGGSPQQVYASIVLLTGQSDLGYTNAAGDNIPSENVASSISADGITTPAFTLWSNATQWGGYCRTNGGGASDIYIRHKTTGAWTAIDKAKWALKVTAILYS